MNPVYGWLTDYDSGETLRAATRDEWRRSIDAGPTGTFTVDGDEHPRHHSSDVKVFGPLRTVYVEGGPESPEDAPSALTRSKETPR